MSFLWHWRVCLLTAAGDCQCGGILYTVMNKLRCTSKCKEPANRVSSQNSRHTTSFTSRSGSARKYVQNRILRAETRYQEEGRGITGIDRFRLGVTPHHLLPNANANYKPFLSTTAKAHKRGNGGENYNAAKLVERSFKREAKETPFQIRPTYDGKLGITCGYDSDGFKILTSHRSDLQVNDVIVSIDGVKLINRGQEEWDGRLKNAAKKPEFSVIVKRPPLARSPSTKTTRILHAEAALRLVRTKPDVVTKHRTILNRKFCNYDAFESSSHKKVMESYAKNNFPVDEYTKAYQTNYKVIDFRAVWNEAQARLIVEKVFQSRFVIKRIGDIPLVMVRKNLYDEYLRVNKKINDNVDSYQNEDRRNINTFTTFACDKWTK